MANHSTLTSLFTDIADAIRDKSGTTGSIVADNFPEAIAAIDTQEDLEPELETQDNLIEQIATTLSRKLPENLRDELDTQDNLIAQIALALEGKCGVGNSFAAHGDFTLSADSTTLTIPAIAGKNNVMVTYVSDYTTSSSNACISFVSVCNGRVVRCGTSYYSNYTCIESSSATGYDSFTGTFTILQSNNEKFRSGTYEYTAW